MQCTSRSFGQTMEGEAVTAYTLTNIKGSSLTVLNYGGIIQSLKVKDRDGHLGNVVLGYDGIREYQALSPHFGCITGRTAGRIDRGRFEIDGERYQLESRKGANLHGGPVGLDKRFWSVTERMGDAHGELMLSYTSPDGECGFPGTLDMVVTYGFDDEDTLTITYKATTDKATIVTLTNHSYFNLSGNPTKDILSHRLTIPADRVVAIDDLSIPKGIDPVEGGPFDFRTAKAIGQDIGADTENMRNGDGYDHPFILNKNPGEVIELEDPESGRKLTVTTSEACVVCYTGNALDEVAYVYERMPMGRRQGVCLETQYYPDAINADFLPERILRPGEVYLEETTFKFTAK